MCEIWHSPKLWVLLNYKNSIQKQTRGSQLVAVCKPFLLGPKKGFEMHSKYCNMGACDMICEIQGESKRITTHFINFYFYFF